MQNVCTLLFDLRPSEFLSPCCDPCLILLVAVMQRFQWLEVAAYDQAYQTDYSYRCTCIVHIRLVHGCQGWKVEGDGREDEKCEPNKIHIYTVPSERVGSGKDFDMASKAGKDSDEQRHRVREIYINVSQIRGSTRPNETYKSLR